MVPPKPAKPIWSEKSRVAPKAGSSKNIRGGTVSPTSPERVAAILVELRKAYPDVVCALNHKNAWELTVATILSAQCTDVRVNLVTPALFKPLSLLRRLWLLLPCPSLRS